MHWLHSDAFSTYNRVAHSVWGRHLGGSFTWSLDAGYGGNSQDRLEAMYNASLPQANDRRAGENPWLGWGLAGRWAEPVPPRPASPVGGGKNHFRLEF